MTTLEVAALIGVCLLIGLCTGHALGYARGRR